MNTNETPVTSLANPSALPSLPPVESKPTPAANPDLVATPAKTPLSLEQKIARLPKATRDMLNVMLDDGLPYHVILDELGGTAQGLTLNSLAKWVRSGYEEYLKERQDLQEIKTQGEYAADLLRELGNVDPSMIQHACLIVVSVQMYRTLRKFGNEALENMLRANPATYLNVLNTLCKMVQPTIDLHNHRRARENAGAEAPAASDKTRA